MRGRNRRRKGMGELVDQWTGGRVGWGEANKIGRVDTWARGKQVAVQRCKGGKVSAA